MTSPNVAVPGRARVVGVLRETALREHRVALDPDAVGRLARLGTTVLVETGAGLDAHFPDASYVAAGARVMTLDEIVAQCDVLVVVRRPAPGVLASMRTGQVLLGLVDPLGDPVAMNELAARGLTVVAFELLPRTLSRAQAMDALSSQASAAGYRAGIVAAAAFGRYLPMMITASGTARPATAMVIGAGVAGLQAIGTLRRLGAVVTGYDVRAASRGEVESLGATFLTSSVVAGAGAGGYARKLTAAESAQQQDELASHLVTSDLVVTTAKVPGRTPPLLVSEATLAAMRPGSVCVDLAASPLGGNVAGSVDGEQVMTSGGVVVVGGGDLASDLATSASAMYAHNVLAMLAALRTDDGAVRIDLADELHRAVVVCHAGLLTSRRTSATPPTPALIGATP